MKRSQLCALALLSLVGAACTQFPSIPSTGCGNGVIEPGTEDCDTFSLYPGSLCLPKGTDNECHLDCSLDENGVQRKCPVGWGCDAESICRAPSGHFSESLLATDVGAWLLSAGDFDGDGRHEVMSSEPLDATGATRLRFNYFDPQGALTETRLFPKTVLSPTINQISAGDTRSDIAFTTGALGVMYGRRDRSWVPEVFSSYRRASSSVRIAGIYDQVVQGSPAFASFISSAGESGFYVGNPETGVLERRLAVKGSIARLAGDLVSGNVFEDSKHSPCFEPVFAMRGDSYFSVVDVCDSEPITGAPVWRDTFSLIEVSLSPAARIDAPPQLVDVDGDGHLDVLLGAGGRPYVALGDGSALAVATPYLAHANDPAFPRGTPLAAADFTGDGALDFAYPDRLVVSRTAHVGATPVYYDIGNRQATPWTAAKIADFNGNGTLDVVLASSGSLNLDFFNGTGTENLTASTVSTSAPVQHLSAGDFDGDLITDLALFEVPLPGELVSTLKVAFGSAFAPLGTPLVVGQIKNAEALGGYQNAGRDNLTTSSSEIIDDRRYGALTLLSGGPDRVPFAPLTLTEFSSNGSVEDAGALAVVAGRFARPDQTDLLALATFRQSGSGLPINVWSIPAIAQPGSAPARVPGRLDPRLTPVAFSLDDNTLSVDVATTSADFDGDGRDEAIFAMPADGGSHCGLLLLRADAAGSFVSAAPKPLIIDEPCADPQIAAVEFEADALPQLALLTGKSGADNRRLYVLWNDGQGGFSAGDIAQISAPEDSPQAFTMLALEHDYASLIYLTKNALRVVHAPSGRAFGAPQIFPDGLTVSNGTGIVAADVNGDHLNDLIFSESGKLHVFKAGLKAP